MDEKEFAELMKTDFAQIIEGKYDYRQATKPEEPLNSNSLIDKVYQQNFDSDKIENREIQVGNPKSSYKKVADMLVQFGFFKTIDDINQDILDSVLDPNFDGEFDMLDFKRFI